MKNVCVVGLGYVGLTLAVYLARKGKNVYGLEIDGRIIESVRHGEAHFYEEGFDLELKQAIDDGKFTCGKEYVRLDSSVLYIVTVGTPLDDRGVVNLDSLLNVVGQIKENLNDGDCIILRSTVKVGVTRDTVKPILDRSNKNYYLGFCPERTLEGCAFEELSTLPQIVSGIDGRSLDVASEFFSQISADIVQMGSVEEAEMVKLLNNSERDLMFAFANEIALMCDSKGLNAHRIIDAANYNYPRSNIRKPGPVGGPCLEKDPHILHEGFVTDTCSPVLLKQSRAINEGMIHKSIDRLFCYIEDGLKVSPSRVSILGFAFKGVPPTGDMRGSLVYGLYEAVKTRYPGIEVFGHDYLADHEQMGEMGVYVCDSVVDAVVESDIVILQNNHPRYGEENWYELLGGRSDKVVIFDYWRQLDAEKLPRNVEYLSFGVMGSK